MSSTAEVNRTALYERHRALGGRLVDFHGWELPIQYEGIIKEHEAVRRRCGLFDVSHMGQFEIKGAQALEFLQKTNANDVGRISPGRAIYSHLPNEKGGVVDDVIISCLAPEHYFMVVNAATRATDWAWLKKQAAGFAVEMEDQSDRYGMIAVQGPAAAELVSADFPQTRELPRFGALKTEVFGQESLITRTGYTGEDGFEFIVPNKIAAELWNNLLLKGRSLGAAPCGLGARDTLRLEAGLLLYGQDIDGDHTTIEAGYGWTVKLDKGDFLGREVLARQAHGGLSRKLFGVRLAERGVPRAGSSVFRQGRAAGTLSSATFSPTLGVGIGMGYLSPADFKPDERVEVEIHGRLAQAHIVRMPFYKSQGAPHV
ncbi:MAG: glycine cleavage system aminomethyltransferase GcvT [Elusimicrobiota bacterium]